MKHLKDQIKKRIEYVLANEHNESVLTQLYEELASYEKQLEQTAWETTPEVEKERIREAFESLKKKENRISKEEMNNFFQSCKEKLSTLR